LEKIEMKKTLVAIAAMAAFTGAMADVTIFGIVDNAYSIKTTTAAGPGIRTTSTKTTAVTGTYTGSELGFKGSEDLGGGLSANFQIHFAPSTDANLAPTGYQSHVGLNGGFGSLKVGQFFSPMFFNNATYDASGYSAFGFNEAGAVNGASGTLVSNSVQYDLPTFVPGLGVSYMIAKGEVPRPAATTTALNDISNIRVTYATGALSAGYSSASVKGAAGASTKQSSTGLSYDLGMAKLMYYATSSKATTATVSDKGSNYGVSIPLGATTVGFTSSSAKTGATQVESSATILQVKYDLSKRSSLILQNGSAKIKSGTLNGSSSKGTSLGLWHSF